VRTFEIVDDQGVVADGAEFSDGVVIVHWRGNHASSVIWGNINDVLAVHEGDGQELRWHEGPPPSNAEAEILDAWLLPSPRTPYHREMKNTVLLQWPELGRAIEHLVREHQRTAKES
jgi:hypothetical protein